MLYFLFYFLEKRKDEDYDEDLEEDLLDEVCVDSDILFDINLVKVQADHLCTFSCLHKKIYFIVVNTFYKTM